MLVVILQMSTIASLTILVILIGRAEKTLRHYMRRKSLESRTELAEDGYLVGNAMTDDIFLDTSQKKLKCI